MPDSTSDRQQPLLIRYFPTVNVDTEPIPPYSLCAFTGVSADGFIRLTRPNIDSQTDLFINGPTAVAVGKNGKAHQTWPAIVAYDDSGIGTTPNPLEITWGAAAGSWLLTKGQAGFEIIGGAAGGLVNAINLGAGAADIDPDPDATGHPYWMLPGSTPITTAGDVSTADQFMGAGRKSFDCISSWAGINFPTFFNQFITWGTDRAPAYPPSYPAAGGVAYIAIDFVYTGNKIVMGIGGPPQEAINSVTTFTGNRLEIVGASSGASGDPGTCTIYGDAINGHGASLAVEDSVGLIWNGEYKTLAQAITDGDVIKGGLVCSHTNTGSSSGGGGGGAGGGGTVDLLGHAEAAADTVTIHGITVQANTFPPFRILVVCIGYRGTTITAFSLKFDGNDLSPDGVPATMTISGTTYVCAVYYLASLSVDTTGDLVLTVTGASDVVMSAVQANGVSGSDSSVNAHSTSGSTTPDSGSIVLPSAFYYLQGAVLTVGPLADADGTWSGSYSDGGQDDGTSNIRLCAGDKFLSGAATVNAAKTGITSRPWIAVEAVFA